MAHFLLPSFLSPASVVCMYDLACLGIYPEANNVRRIRETNVLTYVQIMISSIHNNNSMLLHHNHLPRGGCMRAIRKKRRKGKGISISIHCHQKDLDFSFILNFSNWHSHTHTQSTQRAIKPRVHCLFYWQRLRALRLQPPLLQIIVSLKVWSW